MKKILSHITIAYKASTQKSCTNDSTCPHTNGIDRFMGQGPRFMLPLHTTNAKSHAEDQKK